MVHEGPIRVDGAAQNKADLLDDQMPKPSGPLLLGQRAELDAERVAVCSVLPRRLESFGEGCPLSEPVADHGDTDDRAVTAVAAVVAQ